MHPDSSSTSGGKRDPSKDRPLDSAKSVIFVGPNSAGEHGRIAAVVLVSAAVVSFDGVSTSSTVHLNAILLPLLAKRVFLL